MENGYIILQRYIPYSCSIVAKLLRRQTFAMLMNHSSRFTLKAQGMAISAVSEEANIPKSVSFKILKFYDNVGPSKSSKTPG